MSNTDVKSDFVEFGKKAQILAILSLIMFILGIIGMVVSVVSYISIIFLVIYIIFLILALGNIKNVANKLNNQDLFTFRSRIMIALILAFIGFLFFTIGIGGILAIAYGPDPGSPQAVGGYIVFGIMILIAIVVLIIALIMEILGWSSLRRFFRANKGMFPEKVVSNAETACLLLMLGIIPLIGPLLRIIGYFLLSNLKDL